MGKLIGISGKLGSGKGAIVEIMQNLNSQIQEKFFAFKLKQIVSSLAGVHFDLTMTQDGKNTYIETFDMTLGEMLQKIGTDCLRNGFDDQIWIKSLFVDIDPDKDYIVSDCRFKNEAEAIKERNGILIRINRPINPVAEASGRDLNHLSEIDLDDYEHFDYIITNDGTYEELVEKIKQIYFQIFMLNKY